MLLKLNIPPKESTLLISGLSESVDRGKLALEIVNARTLEERVVIFVAWLALNVLIRVREDNVIANRCECFLISWESLEKIKEACSLYLYHSR